MHDLSSLRLFFAISLDPDVIIINSEIIENFKSKFKPNEIRWVEKNNWHITLQFLEHVAIKDIPLLITNVSASIKNLSSFMLNLSNPDYFPSLVNPKVIILNVTPEKILKKLAEAIGIGIIATNYPINLRPYRAHFTLGYVKNAITNPSLIEKILISNIKIDQITLFQSKPAKGQHHYIPLAKFPLIDN